MKVKTLKDFEEEAIERGELVPGEFDFDVNGAEFRDEIIELIKELKTTEKSSYCLHCEKGIDDDSECLKNGHAVLTGEMNDMNGVIIVLKHLFNIKEEDLK